jgi:hypothetical protein
MLFQTHLDFDILKLSFVEVPYTYYFDYELFLIFFIKIFKTFFAILKQKFLTPYFNIRKLLKLISQHRNYGVCQQNLL